MAKYNAGQSRISHAMSPPLPPASSHIQPAPTPPHPPNTVPFELGRNYRSLDGGTPVVMVPRNNLSSTRTRKTI